MEIKDIHHEVETKSKIGHESKAFHARNVRFASRRDVVITQNYQITPKHHGKFFHYPPTPPPPPLHPWPEEYVSRISVKKYTLRRAIISLHPFGELNELTCGRNWNDFICLKRHILKTYKFDWKIPRPEID